MTYSCRYCDLEVTMTIAKGQPTPLGAWHRCWKKGKRLVNLRETDDE